MQIVIIGAGNIAHFFASRLLSKGHQIVQIYSRTKAHGTSLAELTGAEVTDSLQDIDTGADAYILAVKDDALPEVTAQLRLHNKVLIHCAGAVPLSVLDTKTVHTAVIWALYSIQKYNLPREEVPLIVESGSDIAREVALNIARDISLLVVEADYAQRQALHLNAVLVNNFSNHLMAVAQAICKSNDVSFEILQPIIRQTANQVVGTEHAAIQTGPAIRKDVSTMQHHLALMHSHPEWQRMYEAISASIQIMGNNNQTEN
jgi:predicted short-subunit dehydrogenase-like oxidoreductase (DUF2520 family)